MSLVPGTDTGAVQQFESNAVSEVLTDHSLPSSDANAVLAWGRNDVRAQEWSDLDKIISEPAASRSSNDQLVYNWFQGVDQQQQISAAQDAVNEYLKWSGHTSISDGSAPMNFAGTGSGYCNYEPPGGESGPFGGTYTDNQDQDCFTQGPPDLVTDCTPRASPLSTSSSSGGCTTPARRRPTHLTTTRPQSGQQSPSVWA